ncbi:MAG: hypothetical protein QNJ63_10370 [Calothrix sp. MO_192.B10]|nr:hypothetical protein [Calothrix sp. MO_192.B10]
MAQFTSTDSNRVSVQHTHCLVRPNPLFKGEEVRESLPIGQVPRTLWGIGEELETRFGKLGLGWEPMMKIEHYHVAASKILNAETIMRR